MIEMNENWADICEDWLQQAEREPLLWQDGADAMRDIKHNFAKRLKQREASRMRYGWITYRALDVMRISKFSHWREQRFRYDTGEIRLWLFGSG